MLRVVGVVPFVHVNKSEAVPGVVSMVVASPFHAPAPPLLGMYIHDEEWGANVVPVENVRVIVPVPPGDPVPVVAMIVPATSVEPVLNEHDGLVPPPLVKVQVGVSEPVCRRDIARVPLVSEVLSVLPIVITPAALRQNDVSTVFMFAALVQSWQ